MPHYFTIRYQQPKTDKCPCWTWTLCIQPPAVATIIITAFTVKHFTPRFRYKRTMKVQAVKSVTWVLKANCWNKEHDGKQVQWMWRGSASLFNYLTEIRWSFIQPSVEWLLNFPTNEIPMKCGKEIRLLLKFAQLEMLTQHYIITATQRLNQADHVSGEKKELHPCE